MSTPAAFAVARSMVVVVAPLSTRNLTSRPLTLASTQKWPSIAIGMRVSRPCWTGVPTASAFRPLRDPAEIVAKGEQDEPGGKDRNPGKRRS